MIAINMTYNRIYVKRQPLFKMREIGYSCVYGRELINQVYILLNMYIVSD